MGTTTSKTLPAAPRTRAIRINVSLERLIALSRGSATSLHANTQVPSVEVSSTPTKSHGSYGELLEMQTQLLHDVQKGEEYERVQFLEESTRAFEATASSHRPRSLQPVRLPIDKTIAASSTGIGGVDEEKVRGRLTSSDLRTLLRLHYEKPESWTHEALADKYGLKVDIMRNILNSVGPPKVLPPKGSEHPYGVWFDAPGMVVEKNKKQQIHS